MKKDNIAAIATAQGAAGVAVIRISGNSPLDIAEKMFKPSGKTLVKDFIPNYMYVGEIVGEGFLDYGMCVYFKAPKSFTGEDTVELHCHGGIAITRGILKKALNSGARLAENGEFTKRAFMNGKLSLASCEGLIDMINSASLGGVKAGYSLYRERLTKEVCAYQDELIAALSGIEADMDFPEEGLEETSREQVKLTLNSVMEKIEKLLSTFNTGSRIKNGVNVGIVGKPNTGKSSLLNALLSFDKAIVSDTPGTTRDIVEGSVNIKGVQFNFSDTAGIRDSSDGIEMLGVGFSKKIIKASDLVMFVVDGENITAEDDEIYDAVNGNNAIVVLNKSDKGAFSYDKADITVSALTNDNIDGLKELIYQKTVGNGVDINGDFLCEERHYAALTNALNSLKEGANGIDYLPLDLVSIDVKAAWEYLGEISGKTATEEIIDDIFSRFCVGK